MNNKTNDTSKNVFLLIFSIALMIGGISEVIALLTKSQLFFFIVALSAIVGGIALLISSLIQLKNLKK